MDDPLKKSSVSNYLLTNAKTKAEICELEGVNKLHISGEKYGNQ